MPRTSLKLPFSQQVRTAIEQANAIVHYRHQMAAKKNELLTVLSDPLVLLHDNASEF